MVVVYFVHPLLDVSHSTQVDNTHDNIVTCCVSCFPVMSYLRGSHCLSLEECASVFQLYTGWASRLVGEAVMKERDIGGKIASIMDKHFPSHKETRVLKGIV